MSQTSVKHTPRSGGRGLHVRVKTARGRKNSSTRWLQRQLNDPYVVKAKKLGYRSRAAFKLLELQEKHEFLKPRMRVLDLGSAPGGWTQIALNIVGSQGQVISLDKDEFDPIAGAQHLTMDFLKEETPYHIKQTLRDGSADVVLSDMAPASTGHNQTDHLRIMALAEEAFALAKEILTPGGVFLAKVLQGGAEKHLLDDLKNHFSKVKHVKPPASRKDSSEMYVLALGFRA